MSMCNHPTLIIEITNAGSSFTGVDINVSDQPGNVDGMFMWKKYRCLQCHKIITILQAVVEDGA